MRVVYLHVMDVNELVQAVFSGLSPLVIEDVADEGEWILVRARTPLATAVCPACGASSERVHGYHWRTAADIPIDGRRVVVRVRLRRLVCPTRGCRHTFREQVPGVLERYQRRTARLTMQVKAVVKELAGRVGAKNHVRAGHATCWYSCRMPPRRSCRWTLRWVSRSGSVMGSGRGRSGAALARVRWGLCWL